MIKKITLFMAALFAAVLFSETLLRVIGYNYSPMKIEAKKNNDWRDAHAFEDDHFVYDPYLIWSPRKNYSIFNSKGYRGEELGVKREGEFRIFAIGDSNTLGWQGEKDAPNWPMYLGNLLGESSDRIKVINAGVWGYSSFQGLRRLKEVLRYQPDMVLISFGGNDAHQVTLSDAEYVKKDRKLALYNIMSKSKLGILMIAFLDKFTLFQKDTKQGEKTLVPRVSLEEYINNLNEIVKITNEKNIKTVLLTRPYIGDSPNELCWLNFAPLYNNATIETAEKSSVPVVDIYSYFNNKAAYFIDDSHFTRLGHKIAATLIYEKILPHIPMTFKKISLYDYGDVNKTKIIVPKAIDSKLRNFFDFIWTNGDSKVIDIRYDVKAEDNYLALKTFGWSPFKSDINKLGLKIVTNGSSLKFSHANNDAYYFILDKNIKQINEIRIISPTFVPKELGINDDTRRLGIDVASIEIE